MGALESVKGRRWARGKILDRRLSGRRGSCGDGLSRGRGAEHICRLRARDDKGREYRRWREL